MKKVYWIFIVLVFLGGLVFGYELFSEKKQEIRQVILESLKEQSFFITQTYIFNQPVTIENKTGNLIKDFFWAQEITGYGVIQVNLGVDLSTLSEDKIKIKEDELQIIIPPVKIFNSNLIGEVQIQNKQGIFKKLLDNDDGYNLVIEQLINNAENAAIKTEMYENAKQNSIIQIEKLLKMIIKNKEIKVIIE